MSTAANVSAARASANTTWPQLSNRALDGLKKGPTVEVWFAGDRYATEVDGVQKWDNQHMLRSVHTALLRHFSKRCKRELTENDTKRVSIPFSKNATQLVLGWMTAGGGSNLNTPPVEYPKTDRRPLEIIRDLARFLEIDSLTKIVEKDIAALGPIPPPLPAAGSVPKPTGTKAARAEKICYFCGKAGHIQKVCRERKALFVNESHGPTYPMRGEAPVAKTSVAKQPDSKQPSANLPSAKQPKRNQSNTQKPDAKQPEQAKESSTQSSSTREKLIPFYGFIRAKDRAGYLYDLDFKDIEMEIDWPVTGGHCKVTSAWVRSWEAKP